MANGTTKKLLGYAVLGGLAYGGYTYYQRNKKKGTGNQIGGGTAPTTDPSCLNGVYQATAILSEKIRSELHPAAMMLAENVGPINFNANVQYPAWTYALYLADQARTGSTMTRDDMIQNMLQNAVAPSCDWSHRLDIYQPGMPQFDVWEGTGRMLDVAMAQLSQAQG